MLYFVLSTFFLGEAQNEAWEMSGETDLAGKETVLSAEGRRIEALEQGLAVLPATRRLTEYKCATGDLEIHAPTTHVGDVCRNPGSPWTCPIGCEYATGRLAPYCVWEGTTTKCHASTAPGHSCATVTSDASEAILFTHCYTCDEGNLEIYPTSATHGDICRIPGKPWTCPIGCDETSDRKSPYCVWKGTSTHCHASTVTNRGFTPLIEYTCATGDLEVHPPTTHVGDVCRNPGKPWTCPIGCEEATGRKAPYCVWEGTTHKCHASTRPGHSCATVTLESTVPASFIHCYTCAEGNLEVYPTTATHGDICRIPNKGWSCPIGCDETSGRKSPYCVWKGTSTHCHASTKP